MLRKINAEIGKIHISSNDSGWAYTILVKNNKGRVIVTRNLLIYSKKRLDQFQNLRIQKPSATSENI